MVFKTRRVPAQPGMANLLCVTTRRTIAAMDLFRCSQLFGFRSALCFVPSSRLDRRDLVLESNVHSKIPTAEWVLHVKIKGGHFLGMRLPRVHLIRDRGWIYGSGSSHADWRAMGQSGDKAYRASLALAETAFAERA